MEKLQRDNDQLRQKNATLQRAKEQLERQVEERRREKESLRARLSSEKKTSAMKEQVSDQLSAKLTELREENDRLLQKGLDERE